MASRRTLFRSLWIKGGRRKQRAGRPSGGSSTVGQRRRNGASAMLPGVGSGLTALAILACTFGPMPEDSTAIDVALRKEGVRTPRNLIENFLADSRLYLGL